MTELPLIFVAGFAGSMHCIGMCGGFACGIGSDPRGRAATVRRQLLYNAGRLTSYCFLGAAAGALGFFLIGSDRAGSGAIQVQRALALVSGALMVLIGLQFVGLLAHAGARVSRLTSTVAHALGDLLKAPGPAMPLAFGVVNGLLPCPLVYAFAAQAAATGGAAPGLVVMAVFGLGTFPAMLFAAWGGRRAGQQAVAFARRRSPESVPSIGATRAGALADWRVVGVRIAGALIVVLGLITLARGVLPMAMTHAH